MLQCCPFYFRETMIALKHVVSLSMCDRLRASLFHFHAPPPDANPLSNEFSTQCSVFGPGILQSKVTIDDVKNSSAALVDLYVFGPEAVSPISIREEGWGKQVMGTSNGTFFLN